MSPALASIFKKFILSYVRATAKGELGTDTLYPESLDWKELLEAGGCEHIQITRFEIMGPRRLFLPFYGWDVHLGWLKGCWIFSHSGGLDTHQFHWRRLLGSFVSLGGKTPYT